MRALATQLSINPNTIQRAYNELEGGYIYSIPGKGSFAAANAGADENRKRGAFEQGAGRFWAELPISGRQPGQELLDLIEEEALRPPAGGAVSAAAETAIGPAVQRDRRSGYD